MVETPANAPGAVRIGRPSLIWTPFLGWVAVLGFPAFVLGALGAFEVGPEFGLSFGGVGILVLTLGVVNVGWWRRRFPDVRVGVDGESWFLERGGRVRHRGSVEEIVEVGIGASWSPAGLVVDLLTLGVPSDQLPRLHFLTRDREVIDCGPLLLRRRSEIDRAEVVLADLLGATIRDD